MATQHGVGLDNARKQNSDQSADEFGYHWRAWLLTTRQSILHCPRALLLLPSSDAAPAQLCADEVKTARLAARAGSSSGDARTASARVAT